MAVVVRHAVVVVDVTTAVAVVDGMSGVAWGPGELEGVRNLVCMALFL